MRKFAGALAVAFLFVGQPVWAAATDNATPDAFDREQALINRANEKLKSEDWRAAAGLLKQISEDEGYSLLDDQQQYDVYRLLANTSYDIKDDETAARAIKRACTFERATAGDWNLRFWIAVRRNDDDDSVASLTTIAERWPAAMTKFYDQTVYFAVNKAKKLPAGTERKAKLLQVLFAAKWKPTQDAPDSADYLWVDLVRIYLDRRDTVQASAVAAVIVRPEELAAMRIEKTFDVITAADPDHYDLDKAMNASLARAQARMAAHPELLDAVDENARDLLRMDRPADALAVLDAALLRISSGDNGKTPFIDKSDRLNWVYNTRADVLIRLNRRDDALKQYLQAAHLSENGLVNVSQTINLAQLYYEAGRPQDALTMLAGLRPENASEYGWMAAEFVRACAYTELNDTASLAKSMAYIDEHAADAPGLRLEALLCAGDMERAASVVIAQLADQDTMPATLLRLQHHRQSKIVTDETPFETALSSRWGVLRNRTDVLAAVAKVGRIERLPW